MNANAQRGELCEGVERNALLRERVVQRIGINEVVRIERDGLNIGILRVFAESAGDFKRDRCQRIVGLHSPAQLVSAPECNAAIPRGHGIIGALVERQDGRNARRRAGRGSRGYAWRLRKACSGLKFAVLVERAKRQHDQQKQHTETDHAQKRDNRRVSHLVIVLVPTRSLRHGYSFCTYSIF